ncbi:MAG: alpha/beta hydrolase [Parcubacteria group bacterium]|jgi:hypothetical protein
MPNIFLIHGAYGDPEENWFPWIKSELEKRGLGVYVPKFPTPENQTLENWLAVFESCEKYVNKDSIFIGHSLGLAFILNLLEKSDRLIKAAFLVAGFVGYLGNPKFDEINKTFVDKKFDWEKIKKNCQKFYIFYSDNDPYVPAEKSREAVRRLEAESIFVKGAGHFNKDCGYDKFELLLDVLKKEF